MTTQEKVDALNYGYRAQIKRMALRSRCGMCFLPGGHGRNYYSMGVVKDDDDSKITWDSKAMESARAWKPSI